MYTVKGPDGKAAHVVLEGEKLLPCPFCGSTNLELVNTTTPTYWISCECSAEVTGDSYPDDGKGEHHISAAKSAIERWNHRVLVG